MSTTPNNLPIQPTSFIGRAQAIAQIKQLLATTHLLTLTGVGGTGKTRLALQVATDLMQDLIGFQKPVRSICADGIWFIELAPLADPALVSQTIASVLGVREEPGRPISVTLVDWLRAKQLLLLLDNCEHLIEACAQFADGVLHAAPDVKILATSREALGIAGELSYRVPSLQIPSSDVQLPLAELLQTESVQLFAERAVFALPTFTVTHANANVVAQLCQRLDGIPLALELAAARMKSLSVEQIAARLDNQFRLLTGGSRTAMPRQQTLRAAIDWSHNLLNESERVLLRRLSVFAGGWTLEAAEAVCADDVGAGLAPAQTGQPRLGGAVRPQGLPLHADEIVDVLDQLVNKSLVAAETHVGEAVRYRLLETIRQYAREKLLDSGEGEQWHGRHCEWFYRLAEQSDAMMRSRERPAYLPKLERELDNFRVALEWALATDANRVLHFAGDLQWFWHFGNHAGEGWQWAERALQQTSTDVIGRAKALLSMGRLMQAQGESLRAREQLEESIRLWRSTGGGHGLADALAWCAFTAMATGDLSVGLVYLPEAISLLRASRDMWSLSWALWVRANHAFQCGKVTEAREWCEQSMSVWREVGDESARALALFGRIALQEGDYRHAVTHFTDRLTLYRRSDHKFGIALATRDLAIALFLQGETATTNSLCGESVKLFAEIGNRFQMGMSLRHLSYIVLQQGPVAQATEYMRQSLNLNQAIQRQDGIRQCLRGFAAIFCQQARWTEAVRLLAAAGELGTNFNIFLDRIEDERTRTALHAHLSEADFNAAWEDGQHMTLDEAVALALTEPAESFDAAQDKLPNPAQASQTPTSKQDFGGLTAREREVAALVGQGMSNREIAEKLFVGERTIETHISNIFNKLSFTSRAQVRQWAKEKGLK